MKTPSGTFTLAALAAIAIGAILAFRLFAQSSPSPTPANNYSLSINGDPLPVKNVDDFKKLLNTMVTGNDQTITLHYPSGTEQKGPIFPIATTNTVTPSKKAPTGGDIGVHVTQTVTTTSTADFQKVLNSFATPTPAPKPTPTATAVK